MLSGICKAKGELSVTADRSRCIFCPSRKFLTKQNTASNCSNLEIMSEMVLVKPVFTAINTYLQLQDGNAYIFIYLPCKISFSLLLDKFSKAFVACRIWKEVIFQITLVFPLGSFNMTFVLTRT